MIHVTYETLEGVLVFATGLFQVDMYIWGND
jgi:hypothetical protein